MHAWILFGFLVLSRTAFPGFAQDAEEPALTGEPDAPAGREAPADDPEAADRRVRMLSSAVRHELATLPYYDVFDWIEAQVFETGRVVLRGKVVEGPTKESAEARLADIEEVSVVINDIEVLPPSPSDDRLRLQIYRALFDWNSPLFRYATSATAPIHILVENGHVALEGVVASDMDRQLAYTIVRGVPGIIGVENNLRVE